MELIDNHQMDFCELSYLRFFTRGHNHIEFWLVSHRNNRHFIGRPAYIYDPLPVLIIIVEIGCFLYETHAEAGETVLLIDSDCLLYEVCIVNM